MDAAIMSQVVGIVVPLGICVVLPVMCVWLGTRSIINKDNANKEVLIAALEKNFGLDVENILEKLSPKKKLLKEKLLTRLMWAILCLLFGATVIGLGIYVCANKYGNDSILLFIPGGLLLAIGISFLVNFFMGRKMLAKEIEAEERQEIEQ